MGINSFLPIIATIIMSVIIASTITPSVINKIKSTKVETRTINNQNLIFEAVKRYMTLKVSTPTKIEDLIIEGFIDNKINDNGFGGTYTISIDQNKGTLTISTFIDDIDAQKAFSKSFKNKHIPLQVDTTNEFRTIFILPTTIMHGNGQFITGVPIQATPPTNTDIKYWYDTSGANIILKIFDGTQWKNVLSSSAVKIDPNNIVDNPTDLPTTGVNIGDIKYAYDEISVSIKKYIYMNVNGVNKWVPTGNL